MDPAGRPGARPIATFTALLAAALLPLAGLAAEIPTDRIIVRLKGRAPAPTKRLSEQAGEPLQAIRVMGDGSMVAELPRRMNSGQVRARFANVRDPEVLEVLPDRIFLPAAVPNESQLASQWSLDAYPGIGVQAAGFAPSNPLEAGLLVTLPPAYTEIVQGVGSGTGVAVIGVYRVN